MSQAASPYTFTVEAVDSGQRIDQWLARLLPDRSRSEIQRWIKDGLVQVDGAPVKSSHRTAAAAQVMVTPPDAPLPVPHLQAENLPLAILYEDADLLVIDKPAGMAVHPAAGHEHGTLVNAVLNHCPNIEGVGGEQRPGIVHRLDKDTSGLIVVAKNDRAHRFLQSQFKARAVFKEYLALVEGGVEPPQGRIVAPIGRHPGDRKRQAILSVETQSSAARGREAITEYHTVARYHSRPTGGVNVMTFTLLRVILHTGRTHQIRVHLAWRKHPVVGDVLYGPARPRLPIARQFLHAHRLRFALPATGESREFVSSLPPELGELLDRLASADGGRRGSKENI
jgi:23S rRNA pseudouridine1911/1915/1917 synthase